MVKVNLSDINVPELIPDIWSPLNEEQREFLANHFTLQNYKKRILFDFRSPYRFHPLNQNGWNRKGLISDQGYRKKAWYVINEFYKNINF